MSGVLGSVYYNTSLALSQHTEAMARLQEQAATGSRINRPSDAPSDAYRVLGLESQKRSIGNYLEKIEEMASLLDFSSTVIIGSSDAYDDSGMLPSIARVRTYLTQVTSGLHSDETRSNTANAINDMLEQIVSLANTKHRDQYIFGGSNTASPPYVAEKTDGKITNVTYCGSLCNRNVQVAPGVQSSAFHVGNEVFHSDDRGTIVFMGDTGAAPGTGTSSVSGYTWLTITHDTDNNEYILSINDGIDTVTVPDDGSGSANLAVTDSQTGQVLYVDSTGISDAGVELVSVPGTHDIFNTLITIRDILSGEREVSGFQQELLANSVEALDEVNHLLLQTSVSIGSKINFLDSLKSNLENIEFDTETEAARLAEADIAQIALDLSRREVLYQMCLAIAGRVMSVSLLDFIE